MNCEYEFLFVNDGSKDATLSILKGLAEKDEHVTYLSFQEILAKKRQCMPDLRMRGGTMLQ